MKVGVVGSMHFTEQMLTVRDELIRLGHDAFVTSLASPFVGKTDAEKETIKLDQKMHQDAIREFWRLMQGADAIVAVNLERHGIPGYIGGNTLMEIGFAHVLEQKIFLLNPIPEMPYCQSKIEAVQPVILNGNLSAIT